VRFFFFTHRTIFGVLDLLSLTSPGIEFLELLRSTNYCHIIGTVLL